jgi:hypothetical protein
MWPLAMAGGVGGRNLAAPATGLAGEECGGGVRARLRPICGRSRGGNGSGEPGRRGSRRRPQERRLWQVNGQCALVCDSDNIR